jgi:2-haloacid dehalogenase
MAATILESYAEFGELARVALDMTARKRGVNIDDERKRRILRGMSSLPPHGDVRGGLERLHDAGFRLAALTNSTEATARAQLEHARILERFELVLSADDVRRFKPAPEVYRMAAERLGIPIERMLLVAAHGWDVAGAMHAGATAAFVARHGSALNPLEPEPAYVVHDVVELADALRRAA